MQEHADDPDPSTAVAGQRSESIVCPPRRPHARKEARRCLPLQNVHQPEAAHPRTPDRDRPRDRGGGVRAGREFRGHDERRRSRHAGPAARGASDSRPTGGPAARSVQHRAGGRGHQPDQGEPCYRRRSRAVWPACRARRPEDDHQRGPGVPGRDRDRPACVGRPVEDEGAHAEETGGEPTAPPAAG